MKKQGKPNAIYRQKPAVKLDSQQDHKAVVPRLPWFKGAVFSLYEGKAAEANTLSTVGPSSRRLFAQLIEEDIDAEEGK